MTNNSEEIFDKYAQNYDEVVNKSMGALSSFKRDYFVEYKIQIAKNSIKYSPEVILDFGCGDGAEATCLKKEFTNSQIIGVDVSQESISVAQQKNIDNCSFMHYDGTKLPLEDNSVDFVYSACVFHHIEPEKHPALIKELHRVLKKDSNMIVFEHNPLNPFTKRVFGKCPLDKEAKMILAPDLNLLIKKIGFNPVKTNYTLFFPRFNLFKPLFGLEKFLTTCPLGAQYFIHACKNECHQK